MQSQTIKLARKAYDALEPINNITWTHYRDRLFAMCKAEEKEHRGFLPEFNRRHTADTASVNDAAKLFVVKRIAQYLLGEAMPKGKDILHLQTSCFYAAGLVEEYAEVIRQAWVGLELREIVALDYTEVVKVRSESEVAA